MWGSQCIQLTPLFVPVIITFCFTTHAFERPADGGVQGSGMRALWNQPRLLLFLDTVLRRECTLFCPQPPVTHGLWILDILLIMLYFAD